MKADSKARAGSRELPVIGKSRTGIDGLDEVTYGGLPKGRPTLLCGSAGCGKTLFGMTFLYNGVVEYGEPGVFLAFEERPEDLIKNVGSLNYDVEKLISEKSLPSITSRSNAPRSTRRASTISKVFSFGSATPSIRSAQSVSSSTPSKLCSAG
jgi:KaiC/GvpD/RAD55 family RecA-like ATPase